MTGPAGPRVLKVLRFDGPSGRGLWYRHWTRLRREGSESSKGSEGSRGGGIALRAMSFICRLWRQENLYNRASPAGNAPLSPPTAVLLLKGSMSLDSQVASLPYESSSFATPEGEVLATLCLEILMSPEAERRANLPLRGRRRHRRQRGCISTSAARLYGFLSVAAMNSNCRHCPAPTKGGPLPKAA